MDTVLEIFFYFFYGLGAFVMWIAKGRKTKLVDELSEKHKLRNSLIAFVLLATLIALLIYFINRK